MPAHIQLSPWYVLDHIPRPAWKRLTLNMAGIPSKSLSWCTNEVTQEKTSHLQLEGTGSLGVHGQPCNLDSQTIMHCREVRLAL